MAIAFTCTCGKPLRAKDDAAGKRTKCPYCNAVVAIPEAVGAAIGGGSLPTGPETAPAFDWAPQVGTAAPDAPASTDASRMPSGSVPSIQNLPDEKPRSQPELESADGSSRRYKVLTQRDKGFSGKFEAGKLEEMLNDHASKGWILKAAVSMSIQGHGGAQNELILILEH
jgi:hypothetical protein